MPTAADITVDIIIIAKSKSKTKFTKTQVKKCETKLCYSYRTLRAVPTGQQTNILINFKNVLITFMNQYLPEIKIMSTSD